MPGERPRLTLSSVNTEVAQAERENQRPGDEPDAAYPTFR
jgi:hypothetical protein